MADNGKWQLGFWIISCLCGVWLLALTQSVVANDRIRATEDFQIRESIKNMLEANLIDHSLIKCTLAEIKVELKQKGF